jgi:putative flippase GtrA
MPTDLGERLRKFLAFGAVGAIGTSAHYLVLILLVEAFRADPVPATTLGFLVGALVNYILNHSYTFKSAKAHLDAGPKFFLVAIATGLLNSLMLHVGVRYLGQDYLQVQVITTLILFAANFGLNSIWTFREPDTI